MPKTDKTHAEDYGIIEHTHRFAAWAATTAARRNIYLPGIVGKQLIESAGLRDFLASPDKLPTEPEKIDDLHRKWRSAVIKKWRLVAIKQRPRATINRERNDFTHGRAAKLINVYLKAGLLAINNRDDVRIGALHPPIDRELLKALRISDRRCGEIERANLWMQFPWTLLSSDQYEAVIREIRNKLGSDKRLWMIEEYWPGFQG